MSLHSVQESRFFVMWSIWDTTWSHWSCSWLSPPPSHPTKHSCLTRSMCLWLTFPQAPGVLLLHSSLCTPANTGTCSPTLQGTAALTSLAWPPAHAPCTGLQGLQLCPSLISASQATLWSDSSPGPVSQTNIRSHCTQLDTWMAPTLQLPFCHVFGNPSWIDFGPML